MSRKHIYIVYVYWCTHLHSKIAADLTYEYHTNIKSRKRNKNNNDHSFHEHTKGFRLFAL